MPASNYRHYRFILVRKQCGRRKITVITGVTVVTVLIKIGIDRIMVGCSRCTYPSIHLSSQDHGRKTAVQNLLAYKRGGKPRSGTRNGPREKENEHQCTAKNPTTSETNYCTRMQHGRFAADEACPGALKSKTSSDNNHRPIAETRKEPLMRNSEDVACVLQRLYTPRGPPAAWSSTPEQHTGAAHRSSTPEEQQPGAPPGGKELSSKEKIHIDVYCKLVYTTRTCNDSHTASSFNSSMESW